MTTTTATAAAETCARLYYGEPDPEFVLHRPTHHWVGSGQETRYADGYETSAYCIHCPAEMRIRRMRDGEAQLGNAEAAAPCPSPGWGSIGRKLLPDGSHDLGTWCPDCRDA